MAPLELLPKEPKEGYHLIPSMALLARMTTSQLQHVKGFRIGNEHGSIEFEGETDLTGVDLAKIVTITHMEAEVYNDKDPEQLKMKPPVG